METHYWIIKLRLFRLLGLLPRQKRENITAASYLESTPAARLGLKLLRKFRLLAFPMNHIEPRYTPSGPKLKLAWVRNDKGEVITIDVYHHILHLRRRIWVRLRNSFKDFLFLKDKTSLNMMAAYLGMKVAEEITPTVYIADYARWRSYNKDGGEKIRNILVIPGTDWSAELVEDLGRQVDQVVVGKKEIKRKIKRVVSILKHVVTGTVKTGLKKIPRKPGKTGRASENREWNCHKNGKIMATYAMGISRERRNDISYFHAAAIKPERMAFFIKTHKMIPSPREFQWLRENHADCYAGPMVKTTIPGVRPWQSSPNLKKILKDFYRIYLKTFLQCLSGREKWSFWLLDQYWEMGLETARWKDFFYTNQISIIVHQVPAETNFIPTLAISEIGGMAVSMERSILLDYCTYIHNSSGHLNFVTGPYSLTQIPEPSFSLFTIQSGGLNIDVHDSVIDGIEQLKSQSEIIIAIFDEMPTDWFVGDSIGQLYQAMIDLVDKDGRFGLLIKSKKPQVFDRLKAIYKEIQRLKTRGKCLVADWQVTPSTAAANAHLVVCIPSTAAFESMLIGTRIIAFNPMRSIARIFYSNKGLGRRVFEDSQTLLEALEKYANGQDNSIGDCSDLVSFIDPFNDKKGAERIGNYLNWCLEGFDAGLDRGQTIAAANERYMKEWGKDKITDENAYFKTL
jgi:hypothetical protein